MASSNNYVNDKLPQKCKECHYWEKGTTLCKAFPAGIPNDVLSGVVIHNIVHPDQPNRLVYEPKKK